MASIPTIDVITNPNKSLESAKNGSLTVSHGGILPVSYDTLGVEVVSSGQMVELESMYTNSFIPTTNIDGGGA